MYNPVDLKIESTGFFRKEAVVSKIIIPQGYQSALDLYETQTAIGDMKRIFEKKLSTALNLKRVSAPLFVEPKSGLNDDLSGEERPVEFDIKEIGRNVQIVHSLAKWKRMALKKYQFPIETGLYTDMNAIRRDDEIDNLHSIYVDQWDWEKIITPTMRTQDYLKTVVTAIVEAICDTLDVLKKEYPGLRVKLNPDVKFITSQALEDLYPEYNDKERENAITKAHGTVFIMEIGGKLKSGKPHDMRAPDYDDWGLNGDILFWHEGLGCAIEISSMGIRVDAKTLDAQLNMAGCNHRRELTYHKALLAGEYPLTIGGGIGQSRLSMLLLEKIHVGEVQVSVWDDATTQACDLAGVKLL